MHILIVEDDARVADFLDRVLRAEGYRTQVARNGIDSIDKLPGKRLYLPQQDSLRSYVAKGLLTEAGLKLPQFSKVTYGNTSGGGLVALSFDMADVTVADEAQAKEWITQHPGQARILKTTRPVPGGMNMVVRKDFCATE